MGPGLPSLLALVIMSLSAPIGGQRSAAESPVPQSPQPCMPARSQHPPHGGDGDDGRAQHRACDESRSLCGLIARAPPRCQKKLAGAQGAAMSELEPAAKSQGPGTRSQDQRLFRKAERALHGPDRGQVLCLPFSSCPASQSSDGHAREALGGRG